MKFKVRQPQAPYVLTQFGGTSLGREYVATNQYLTRDGKPWVYRMGEMHFSRVDRGDWERELIKMKEGGIEIVASYLFWIHHEEQEGIFDFSGNRDLKAFCAICKKLQMPMFLRMGPWAHGEARNGGFPDWLLEKCGGKEHTRCNEEPYLTYAKRFYAQVYEQVKDCMDTFVGIQIENELHRNREHMDTLRKYAQSLGFRAPIWTATGWGPAGTGAHIPTESIIPVYGSYPEAPWTQHIDPLPESESMIFSKKWDRCGDIGTDIFDSTDEEGGEAPLEKGGSYPYLTCELGGGIQVSYHRRPIISSADITSMVICRLGSGCNGLGYYMYHGGKNPIGAHTRMMQECRVTGYKNDYAIVSYDFQAPLGDCGQLRQSYFALRSIHSFLEVSGEKLATMPAFLPTDAPENPFDKGVLRCAVRSDGSSGFVFFNNHSRGHRMNRIQTEVQIELPNAAPLSIPLDVAPSAHGIIPFRFPIGTETVEWISAIPVKKDEKHLVFEEIHGLKPQICLQNCQIIDFDHSLEIGGIEVSIVKQPVIKREKEREILLSEEKNKLPDTVFEHIQNIGWQPLKPLETVDYSLILPPDTRYLRIRADGNVGAVFANGELLSDFYLCGIDWIVDVRGIDAGEELILKILPFDEENKSLVYLEYDMPLGHITPRVFALSCETPVAEQNSI